jgi:hypothetical protein
MTRPMPRVRPRACGRCGGAAAFDARDGDWACLLCARPVVPPVASGGLAAGAGAALRTAGIGAPCQQRGPRSQSGGA